MSCCSNTKKPGGSCQPKPAMKQQTCCTSPCNDEQEIKCNLDAAEIRGDVQKHYGDTQQSCCSYKMSTDPTMTCPGKATVPQYLLDVLKQIHPEVTSKYYGCGIPIPEALEGCTVLDMGCGSGRDVYICSKLVGPNGKVVGVDMTKELLTIAREHVQYHKGVFGFSNVDFKQGFLEDLDKIEGLKPRSFDVIISNCVVNLTASKQAVLNQAFQLLKPGGEIYFSDTYSENDIAENLKQDKYAWGECFTGALRWDAFVQMVHDVGFCGPFVTASSDYFPVDVGLKEKLAGIKFWSRTVRLLKPSALEKQVIPDNSDHQSTLLTYNGLISDAPQEFCFDYKHSFKTGQATAVPRSLYQAVKGSRYGKYF